MPGLDSLFVGDHHATPGPYYQNVPITARMLAEWGDRPAGCLFLLYRGQNGEEGRQERQC